VDKTPPAQRVSLAEGPIGNFQGQIDYFGSSNDLLLSQKVERYTAAVAAGYETTGILPEPHLAAFRAAIARNRAIRL